MQGDEIRLRLVELVVNQATRVGLSNAPGLLETCTQLEKYVVGSPPVEDEPTPTTRKTLNRPAKTTELHIPGFIDPARGG